MKMNLSELKKQLKIRNLLTIGNNEEALQQRLDGFDNPDSLSIAQLRFELGFYGLIVDGPKHVLSKRLYDFYSGKAKIEEYTLKGLQYRSVSYIKSLLKQLNICPKERMKKQRLAYLLYYSLHPEKLENNKSLKKVMDDVSQNIKTEFDSKAKFNGTLKRKRGRPPSIKPKPEINNLSFSNYYSANNVISQQCNTLCAKNQTSNNNIKFDMDSNNSQKINDKPKNIKKNKNYCIKDYNSKQKKSAKFFQINKLSPSKIYQQCQIPVLEKSDHTDDDSTELKNESCLTQNNASTLLNNRITIYPQNQTISESNFVDITNDKTANENKVSKEKIDLSFEQFNEKQKMVNNTPDKNKFNKYKKPKNCIEIVDKDSNINNDKAIENNGKESISLNTHNEFKQVNNKTAINKVDANIKLNKNCTSYDSLYQKLKSPICIPLLPKFNKVFPSNSACDLNMYFQKNEQQSQAHCFSEQFVQNHEFSTKSLSFNSSTDYVVTENKSIKSAFAL